MKKTIGKMMPYFARFHWSNWRKGRWHYPQLWWVANKIARFLSGQKKGKELTAQYRKTQFFIEVICGFLTGHELSETEWGYGGGRYIDRHCRWCDKTFQLPKQEEFLPKVFGDFVDGFDKDQNEQAER